MNPEELDEQFKGLEEDKQVQAAMAGKRPAAAKKKRATVADLTKTIDELTELVDVNIFSWLDKLDTRVRQIESVGPENLPSFVSDTTERFQKLENATSALADIARSIIDDVERLQPAKAEEIEFAKPPKPSAPVSTRAGDIEAVASVCVSMNDVLLIARALRDSQDINVMDKNKILNIACRSAGVEPTHGIQIRAGIHDMR